MLDSVLSFPGDSTVAATEQAAAVRFINALLHADIPCLAVEDGSGAAAVETAVTFDLGVVVLPIFLCCLSLLQDIFAKVACNMHQHVVVLRISTFVVLIPRCLHCEASSARRNLMGSKPPRASFLPSNGLRMGLMGAKGCIGDTLAIPGSLGHHWPS